MNKRIKRVKPKDIDSSKPRVISNSMSQLGELTLRFDIPMLFDEIFYGYNFISIDQGSRSLNNVELSSILKLRITRGAESSAEANMLNFDASLKSYDEQSFSLQLIF